MIQTDDTTVTVLDPTLGKIKAAGSGSTSATATIPTPCIDYTDDRSGDGPQRDPRGLSRATSRPTPIRATTPCSPTARSSRSAAGCTRGGSSTRRGPATRRGRTWRWRGSTGSTRSRRRPRRRDWDDAQRHALRREKSRPILDKLKAWLDHEDQQRVLPKSPIGEAIGYALNHWAALERYLEAGFLEIDNGASERAMKPVALGRKNWLFAGSDDGGQDGGDPDEPVHDVQEPGRRPVGLPDRRAGSGEHAPRPAGSRNCCRTAGKRCARQPRRPRASGPTDLPDGGTLPVEVDRRRPGDGRSAGPEWIAPITDGRPGCQGRGWPDGAHHWCDRSSSPSVPVAEPWINLELVAGISSRLSQWERQGLPSSRRNPCDHSPYSSDPGVTRQAEWTTS